MYPIVCILTGNRDCADNYPVNWRGLYNGTRNTTITGKPCKKWSESNHPSYGIDNYCRSPSVDGENRGPWCYISESPWWDFCFVPRCSKYKLWLLYQMGEKKQW